MAKKSTADGLKGRPVLQVKVGTTAGYEEQGAEIGFGGAALFVLTFLFFWVGTTPFADVDNVVGVTADAGRSNLVNQIVTLLLSGALFAYGMRSPMRHTLLQPRVLLVLVFSWYFFTAGISSHPNIGLRRMVLSVITCFNASVFLLLPRSERQLTTLLAIGSLVTLAIAYFGVVFLPLRALHQATDVIEPMLAGAWRGHYPHKNAAAVSMLLLVLFGFYIRSMGRPVTGILIIVLGIFFLIKTGGKTSTAMLPFIVILSIIFEKWKWTRIPIAVGGIAAFNFVAVGSAVFEPLREAITAVGIDASFTNRADIWRLAFTAIGNRPFTGYGMDSFWKTEEIVYSGGGGVGWAVAAFNAHNAYLDTLLAVGIPGFVLTIIWVMFVPLRSADAAYSAGNNKVLTRLFVRIWLYALYMSCMESTFLQNGGSLWFAMLFSIFGLRLQATAHLKSNSTIATGARVAHGGGYPSKA